MSFDTLPCSLKARIDRRATENLRTFSEQDEQNTARSANLIPTAFAGSYSDNEEGNENEDGLSLMYQLLNIAEDENTFSKPFKTPIAAWQVCPSVKQHKDGYQLADTPENVQPARKNEGFRKDNEFLSKKGCYYCNSAKEFGNESTSIQPQVMKDVRVKNDTFMVQGCSIQDGGRLSRNGRFTATGSPHDGFRFHHFKNMENYIKHYNEQITNFNIRKYIQIRLKEKTFKVSPNKVSTKARFPKPSFTIYRFCIPKEGGSSTSSILKIGPCPGMVNQSDAEIERKEKMLSKKSAGNSKDERAEIEKPVKTIKFESGPHLRNKNCFSTTSAVQENREKVCNTFEKEAGEAKLKKVKLRIQKMASESFGQTSARIRASKSKHLGRPFGLYVKSPMQSTRSGSEMTHRGKAQKKPTLGGREFLRITTPKPLIHAYSQTPSDLGESPLFSPDKSMSLSSMGSPVQTDSRNQLIAEILMKGRKPQAVFPKNSKFQACITPSNYSTRSVESHIRQRKDVVQGEGFENSHEKEKNEESCCPSISSKPRIGPFISG